MKTCLCCGTSKDPSLFSDSNPNLCLACDFGLHIDQEDRCESTDWLKLAADIVTPEEIAPYLNGTVELSAEDQAALERAKPRLMRRVKAVLRGES